MKETNYVDIVFDVTEEDLKIIDILCKSENKTADELVSDMIKERYQKEIDKSKINNKE